MLLRLKYSCNTPGVCSFSSFPVPCSLGLLCTLNAYKVILFLWRYWFFQVMGLFYPNFCHQHVFHCIMIAPIFSYRINFHNFALNMHFFDCTCHFFEFCMICIRKFFTSHLLCFLFNGHNYYSSTQNHCGFVSIWTELTQVSSRNKVST